MDRLKSCAVARATAITPSVPAASNEGPFPRQQHDGEPTSSQAGAQPSQTPNRTCQTEGWPNFNVLK